MAEPPTGTVTFLFTDVEGSTKLWERYPQAMQATIAQHDEATMPDSVELETEALGSTRDPRIQPWKLCSMSRFTTATLSLTR
jgi:hypothetical protein